MNFEGQSMVLVKIIYGHSFLCAHFIKKPINYGNTICNYNSTVELSNHSGVQLLLDLLLQPEFYLCSITFLVLQQLRTN